MDLLLYSYQNLWGAAIASPLLYSWGNLGPESVSILHLAVIGSSTWRELTLGCGDGQGDCDLLWRHWWKWHRSDGESGKVSGAKKCLINTMGLGWPCTKIGLTWVYGVPAQVHALLVYGETANNTLFLLWQCPQYLNTISIYTFLLTLLLPSSFSFLFLLQFSPYKNTADIEFRSPFSTPSFPITLCLPSS